MTPETPALKARKAFRGRRVIPEQREKPDQRVSGAVKRRAGSPDAAPIFDFGIPKGADAVNPGDMTKAVYDPKGKAQDIFAYADQKMPKTGGAFTGGVSGVSPTSGSTKGFRNIYFGSGAPASSLGANGDVYINIG